MEIRTHLVRFVSRLLGLDTTELDKLLAERRMLRRAIRENEKVEQDRLRK